MCLLFIKKKKISEKQLNTINRICPCIFEKQNENAKRLDQKIVQSKLAKSVTVINVLPEEYYEQCHIPGTINIPFYDIEEEAVSWDREKEIILYCFMEGTSSAASTMLEDLGFKNVYICIGGLTDWAKNKLPLEGTLVGNTEITEVINRMKQHYLSH